jgi:Tfp pilus assembly protein PilO
LFRISSYVFRLSFLRLIMQSTVQRNSWIVIVPVAVIAAAYVYCFYLPGRKAIADLRDQIRAKHDFVMDSEQSTRSLRAGKEELEKTEAYVATCRRCTPEEKDLGDILGMIHVSAGKAKVRVTRFDPQPATSYERLRRVPVTVGLVGQFGDIHQFLANLEAMPRYIWVSSVKMDVDAKSGKEVVGEISVVIFVSNSDGSGYAVCSK